LVPVLVFNFWTIAGVAQYCSEFGTTDAPELCGLPAPPTSSVAFFLVPPIVVTATWRLARRRRRAIIFVLGAGLTSFLSLAAWIGLASYTSGAL